MKVNKLFKKVNLPWRSKKPREIETDAAPSRPRLEEEMSYSSSSSSEDEEFYAKRNVDNDQPQTSQCNNDQEIPEFKQNSSYPSNGGQTFIHIEGSSKIQIGNRYKLNVQNGPFKRSSDPFNEAPPPRSQEPQVPPPEIERTFSNRKAAENTDFISIKYEIGSNWRGVAKQLGLSDGVIQQVYKKYEHKDISEVFYQLLLKWRESQPRTTTTIGLLCEALWKCNETSAAKILAKQHMTN